MQTTDFIPYRTDDGHKYELKIEFVRGVRGSRIIGAEIYNSKHVYLGYWDFYNMPLAMMRVWEKLINRKYGKEKTFSPKR